MADINLKINVKDSFSKALKKFNKLFNASKKPVEGVEGKLDKLSQKEDKAAKSSFDLGGKIQKLYYALQTFNALREPLGQTMDDLSAKMRMMATYGDQAGESLYKRAQKAAQTYGRAAGEMTTAVEKMARIGMGEDSSARALGLADRYAKFTKENDAGATAETIADAVKSKNISGIAEMFGGGEAVERLLRRKGLERALNAGDLQKAFDIIESVGDQLGYTQEKAEKLNNTLSNKISRAINLIKNRITQLFGKIVEKFEPLLDEFLAFIQSENVQHFFDRVVESVDDVTDAVQGAIRKIQEVKQKALEWINQNQKLIQTAAQIAAITAAIFIMRGAWTAAKTAAIAFGVAAKAAILSPVVLVASAIGVIGVGFMKLYEMLTGESLSFMDSMIHVLVGGFTFIGGFIFDVVGVIANVLQRYFLGVVDYFQNMVVNPIVNSAVDMAEFLINLIHNPIDAIYMAVNNLVTRVLDMMAGMANVLGNVFGSQLANDVQTAINGVKTEIDKKNRDKTGWFYVSLQDKKLKNGSFGDKIGRTSLSEKMFTALGYGKEDLAGGLLNPLKVGKKAIKATIDGKEKIAETIGDKFKGGLDDLQNGITSWFKGEKLTKPVTDLMNQLFPGAFDGPKVQDDVGKIRNNTSRKQDLSWMKELAEREFTSKVNVRTLQPNITVNVTKPNAVNGDVGNIVKDVLVQQTAAGATTSHGSF